VPLNSSPSFVNPFIQIRRKVARAAHVAVLLGDLLIEGVAERLAEGVDEGVEEGVIEGLADELADGHRGISFG
jgi:hypothetical protein